ncbi:MAG TPA: YlzJ-like family protein [Oscillospiraceae bacterium]|jgi:hypothetical protein|nr:YlzJ-like family protein [Oscillospiraceae bacterium]HRW56988.1 YlzJ-like family protein [Oscillospiraceae bacterium]
MILYSAEPLDCIFPPEEHEREFLEFEGGTLEGYRENGHFTVTGLISTDPALFLDEKFRPGATLTCGKGKHFPDSGYQNYSGFPMQIPEGTDCGFISF